MKFLASDLMRGRDTASSEIRLAAEYLASRLSAAGAEPAGDSELRAGRTISSGSRSRSSPRSRTGRASRTRDRADIGSRRVVPLQIGSDVTFFPNGITPGEVEAEVVFAGYGRVNAEENVDDYAGLDVKNRFVLVLAGQPPAKPKDEAKEGDKAAEPAQPKARPRVQGGGGNAGKLDAALKRGAAGPDRDPASPGPTTPARSPRRSRADPCRGSAGRR